jgi:hypothetical protein
VFQLNVIINLGHELLQVGFKSGAVKVNTGHASRPGFWKAYEENYGKK